MNAFVGSSLIIFALGVAAIVVSHAKMRRVAVLKALLRDRREDIAVLRSQLKITTAERDYWIAKCKKFVLPEVDNGQA
jgi:hypothetical protein